MKMKRWLSRGIVLAMVVALMVPMPVLAKGKSGGKLVKSVTAYDYKTSGRWQADYKTTYKYDKKNNPVEFATISYYSYFLGAPVRGSKSVTTAKYKYKGKTPKSAKFKDGAGKVYETRKYKKGRVVSIKTAQNTSSEYTTYDEAAQTSVFKGDNIFTEAETKSISYNKKGLAVAVAAASSSSDTYANPGATNESESGSISSTYTVTHKKGIPSYILGVDSSVSTNVLGDKTTTTQRNADGTVTTVYPDGTSETEKNGAEYNYTTFNGKGIALESGVIKTNPTTGVQTTFPKYRFEHKIKKGKVTQTIVYYLTTDPTTGAVTKAEPIKMFKFKYAKKKISKVRYLSMMNSLIESSYVDKFDEYVNFHNAFFEWY